MTIKNQKIQEEFGTPDHDVNGMGSVVPDPVDTGETARPQDNMAETDAPTGVVQGQPVPRSAILRALVSTLQGLDAVALDRIANELDTNQDVNIDPANSVPDLQGANLQSISVKEDIEEIFAGEETLSEEFKERTTLVFEAAVGARVAVIEAELIERQEEQVEEAVTAVTEQLVDQLDKYISFATENFVEENTPVLEQTVRSVASEKFMEGVIALAEQYNITVPQPSQENVTESLETRVAELTAQLNEAIDDSIEKQKKIVGYQKQEIFEDLVKGLTIPQKTRFQELSNAVITEDVDLTTYQNNLQTLKESVVAKTTPVVNENTNDDGVILMEDTNQNVTLSKTEQAVFGVLNRMKR